jgi:hypothetical protein
MTTAINRTTVGIPTPSGEQIEAGYYQPDGAGPFHAVLTGHGMGAVKAGGCSHSPNGSAEKDSPSWRSTTADGAARRVNRATRRWRPSRNARRTPCQERRIRTRCTTAPVHLDSWRRALGAGVLPAARSVGRSEPVPPPWDARGRRVRTRVAGPAGSRWRRR